MSSLKLFLLGPPRLELEGRLLNIRRRKVWALLAYLALSGEPQRRDALAARFWPDSAQNTARAALARHVSELKKILGREALTVDRERVGLPRSAQLWLDVDQFQQRLADCPEATPDCLDALTEAITLYRDDFLAGFNLPDCPDFDEWQFFQTEGLRQALATALECLVVIYNQQGDYEAAIPYARRRVALDPLHEPARYQLIELYARANQRPAALRQYQEYKRMLAEELGTAPSSEITVLYQHIRTAPLGVPLKLSPAGPDAPGASSVPLSLPSRQQPPLPDPYVHRPELEQTLLSKVAAQQTVVLTGLGGTGKSTLAAWLAHQAAGSLVEGVIWVDECQLDGEGFDVFEAQGRLARSFNVELKGTSLAERAAELRTLLWDKTYLLVLDEVWNSPDLVHLKVHNPQSPLLVTSRDAAVAYTFGSQPPIRVDGLSQAEGLALLKPGLAGQVASPELDELLSRVGYLPLALVLIRALLQMGYTVSELLAHFRQEQPDLHILDISDVQTRTTSLETCFDMSYNRLPSPETQQFFAQLGQFSGTFQLEAVSAVWGLEPLQTRRLLDQLVRLALVIQEGGRYRLQPLLRDYARQKLAAVEADLVQSTRRRHAAFYIRRVLYHPQVLQGMTDEPPPLDEAWSDIVAGVKWAATNDPELATGATILAHTERPALLEVVGPSLIEAIEAYSAQAPNLSTQATLYELLGSLQLMQGGFEAALRYFEQGSDLWLALENGLASSRLKLRQAGVYLLQQAPDQAAEAARQAQGRLAQSLPLAAADLVAARRLFYWFDMIYVALVRWEQLPQADVARLAELAAQTGDDSLKARGLHIYRLWCTVREVDRPPEVRSLGRDLARQAIQLWRATGETDKADGEAMWSEYLLTGRCDAETATRFAQRISDSTPQISQAQITLIKNEGIRWWLQTPETERVAWLSQMMPRYLKASDCPDPPLQPDSREWQWVRDIIGIRVTLRQTSRRVTMVHHLPPPQHFLNAPEWRVFAGQQILSFVDQPGQQLVEDCLARLEAALNV